MRNSQRYQNQFFFIMLGIAVVLTFLVVRPFITSILIAMAFAVVLRPLFKAYRRFTKGKFQGACALFTLFTAVLIIVAPATLLVSRIVIESQQAYATFGTGVSHFTGWINQIEEPIQHYIPSFRFDVESIARPIIQFVATHAGDIFATTLSTVLNAVIIIIALYFLLRNGDDIKKWLMEYSPLPDASDVAILHRIEATINSVFRGSLLVSCIQGAVATIGYAFFGLPNPTLWGVATAASALIPGIGTALVGVPAVIYLYTSGHVASAIGMLVWQICVTGLIDNLLSPKILSMGNGVNIHPFLIFISILGGLSAFGGWGFMIGPLVLSFFLSLVDVYRDYILTERDSVLSKRRKA
jgi:predicted PurR-regulated permease PerM